MSVKLADVAQALLTARASGAVAPTAAFADAVPDAPSAYAVQALVASALGWHGDQPGRHWKSGGAARDAGVRVVAVRGLGGVRADARRRRGDCPGGRGGAVLAAGTADAHKC